MSHSALNKSLGTIVVVGTLTLSDLFRFPAHSQSLDRQQMCEAQANRAFQEFSTENKELTAKLGMTAKSHYNPKINRCLILTDNTYFDGRYLRNYINLWDALKLRNYASWFSQTETPEYSVELVTCELTRNLKDKITCTNREEFDGFISEYMEE
ncbi:hypothetical protein [Bradyrhizobium erythrophlei]|jgi:hypothetical protein|uniref:Uncharacterized protein n=1 Tax=Bradyrhizobium erythrophlei TaxID=1437360 RepID=A0A1M7UCW3_9BRAD|nr:hypothetical protein [Bradyrhizobium erythrophlei]SHN80785.1 hypothetical protein SAMN05444170_4505 [Bradyrhizobium erythrophlei]